MIQLQAQITSPRREPFERNTLRTTELVLAEMRRAAVPFLVHMSSSAVNSAARDDYSCSKTTQEQMVRASGIPHCVLRPTLLFGRHDPKHLGWLAGFLRRVPVFPVPGHGRYLRQPIYVEDLCRVVEVCLDRQPDGQVYDLAGAEGIHYIDLLRGVRNALGARTPMVRVPIPLFSLLLHAYALGSEAPPFTEAQLRALTVGDEFPGVDLLETFGVVPTPLASGLRKTFAAER